MKEELTERMHSEFTVSKDIDIKHRVGSAMQFANMLDKTESDMPSILKSYAVTMEDYYRWKKHWNGLGLFVKE